MFLQKEGGRGRKGEGLDDEYYGNNKGWTMGGEIPCSRRRDAFSHDFAWDFKRLCCMDKSAVEYCDHKRIMLLAIINGECVCKNGEYSH